MSDEERVSVKTSVPRYQKEAWKEHADALDMTQSEFVRTMTQAGRRGFEPEPPEPPSSDADPGGNVLRNPILESLSENGHRRFDEIVESLSDAFEDQVDETLQALQNAGLVQYSRREGYTLTGDSDVED